ncbi:hypothetical protein HBI80_032990 [Parastagonospora nodorum]|nr:hypothetical protein HBH51_125770 [Parastagonospora nodorum]KAH4236185.1 hypothetical protein HBI05_133820 [Parastagonospora nodorum]KAH4242172.1 hypothetical protein HBI06_013740 [Parastagonospora nodorum]KAH4254771.1 hypothetical protein HBI03_181420 [Parastagonospora nodorum]KAH4282769.1 hypothetical protein HBI04_014370 [Parastagonospora nodorum]
MASFKRGGSRGGGSAYKKGFTKKRAAPDDDESAPRTGKKSKGDEEDEEDDATPVVPELKTNDDGEKFVGLSAGGKRRITIREFKNTLLLDVREYWTNDAGELKPGKKGISLNLDQYNTLVAALPLIEVALAEKKATAARPDYDAAPPATTTSKDEAEDEPLDASADEVDKVDEEEGSGSE